MQIILCQTFPLGRFHATPWKVFPYDDPHGEWPPSPWRLLRALIARSYQIERERPSVTREQRESLVAAFSRSTISWRLPEFTWRGPGLQQYQPVEFGWDHPAPKKLKLIHLDKKLWEEFGGRYAVLDKSSGKQFRFEVFNEDRETVSFFETENDQLVQSFRDAKKSGKTVELKRHPPAGRGWSTTKVLDNFWLTGRSDSGVTPSVLWWFLSGDGWGAESLKLLDECLARMTYFGRAESITEISLVRERDADVPESNCHLHDTRSAGMVPVLAPMMDATLEQAQASTSIFSSKDEPERRHQ